MSACTTTINGYLAAQSSFDGWKGSTTTTINQLKVAGARQTGPTAQEQQTLLQTTVDVNSVVACVQEKLQALNQVTNQIQAAQNSILDLQDTIKNAEENVKIAKDRVAMIRNPEAHPSYYEGWFKLMDRPMRPTSIPIFIGITVFFGISIILLLLRVVGVTITIPTPTPTYGTSLWSRILSYMSLPMIIILIVLVIAVSIYFRR
jgi:hypothetical protein